VTHGRWYRRRPLLGVLAVALVALAVPISYAVAASKNSTQTVNVERYDNSCNYLSKVKSVGTATLEQNKGGNSVSGSIDLHGLGPSSYYYMYVYADTYQGTPLSNCPTYWYVGKTKVGSDGRVQKSFTITGTAGYNDFWFYAYSTTETDRSAPVHF
jgi:hypothetical protein